MYEKKLIGEPGGIEKKGAQGFCFQYKRRDPVEEYKEENAGERRGLHRKVNGKRKQEEKGRQSERKEPDPFSLLQAVAEPEIQKTAPERKDIGQKGFPVHDKKCDKDRYGCDPEDLPVEKK